MTEEQEIIQRQQAHIEQLELTVKTLHELHQDTLNLALSFQETMMNQTAVIAGLTRR